MRRRDLVSSGAILTMAPIMHDADRLGTNGDMIFDEVWMLSWSHGFHRRPCVPNRKHAGGVGSAPQRKLAPKNIFAGLLTPTGTPERPVYPKISLTLLASVVIGNGFVRISMPGPRCPLPTAAFSA